METITNLFTDMTFVSFVVYMLFMVGIGMFFCNKNETINEYLLGGRGIGSWVTAFSAQASDMSGWLLMGLPGAIYLGGMADAWVAIGLWAGTWINWVLVAPRLRVYTEKTSSLTLSSFFAERFKDPSGLLRLVSALIILLFFTIYAASGLMASGKLFDSMFKINYQTAVLIGAAVIMCYTMLGGYLAVCWTDLIQGTLMFCAIIIVPIIAILNNGGFDPVLESVMSEKLSLLPSENNDLTFITIISCAVWGLGYFGQPHILSRFMSVRDVKILPRTTAIAMSWVTISLIFAVVIGLVGKAIYPGLTGGNQEKVFIYMIQGNFAPWLGGIMLAAIMAAIMSTIDSQLLVSSSALTEDFYRRVIRRTASTKEAVFASRAFVLFITIIATVIALFPSDTIFNVVKFAWGGFGAAFGPVVLMALYSKKTTWLSALLGMIVGSVVMITWYMLGLNKYMYEILPGFVANFIVICLVNVFYSQKDTEIIEQFEQSVKESRAK